MKDANLTSSDNNDETESNSNANDNPRSYSKGIGSEASICKDCPKFTIIQDFCICLCGSLSPTS